MNSVPLAAMGPDVVKGVSRIESIHQRIDRMAEDQEEVVDRIRAVQAAVDETLLLLKSREGQPIEETSTGDCEPPGFNVVALKAPCLVRGKPMRSASAEAATVELNISPQYSHQKTTLQQQQHYTTLPPGWPMSVQLRKGMRGACEISGDLIMIDNQGRWSRQVMFKAGFLRQEQQEYLGKMLGPWNPHTGENVVFDCLGLLILLYDLCSTPFQLAWNIPIAWPLHLCNVISVIYWTVCIPVAFRTGYYECGELKMGSKDIAWNYIRKYLLFDMLLVLIDWIAVITSDPSGTLVALRVCRLLKVVRALKIMKIIDKIVSHRLGNNSQGLVLLKVLGFTLVFTHVGSCAWYALGSARFAASEVHWIDKFKDEDGSYIYLSAYHWVLNQITLGSSDVAPTNSHERLFCIILNVFGLLYSSTIVSLVSAQAMEYVTVRRKRLEDMSRLSSFLDQHKVELRMANRVRRQANDRLKANFVMLTEDRVKALQLLSSDLRSEILSEIRWPHVITHPLFQYWARIDYGATCRLCQQAVFFHALMPQDCAFMPCTAANEAFYITPLRNGLSSLAHGSAPMSYTQFPDSAFVEEQVTVAVKEGTWIAEAALWTEWTYVGKLIANTTCQLLAVDACKLQDILPSFSRIADFTRLYAREFCLRLRVASPPFSPWPTDLYVPDADPDNLLSEQAYRGLLMREWHAGRLDLSQDIYEELLAEVTHEKSALKIVPGQGFQRVVFVCALQLQRGDGHIFVQVGSWTEAKGVKAAGAVLPGTKRDRSELPQKALQRLLSTDLIDFEPGIELTHSVEEAEYKESEKYGMMTKYLRTVNFAELRQDFEMPPLPVAKLLDETPPGATFDIDSLPSYCRQEVYVIHTKQEKADLYAWLSEEDLALVRGPEQDVLKSWVLSLDPSKCRVTM